MKRIVVTVSMGLVGCNRKSVIEVEDELSDEDIDELARDAMFSLIEWDWRAEEPR